MAPVAAKRKKAKAPRKRATLRKRRSDQITLDDEREMQLTAEALLGTSRRIKQFLIDETDAAERSGPRGLLDRGHRGVRAYREALEAIALEVPRRTQSALRE